MKGLLICLTFAALASARNIGIKDLEIGFCGEDTPRPLTITVANVDPFPIPVVGGTEVNVDVEFDLLETCPVGTTVKLDMVLQGIIDIPIPCIEVNEQLHIGSCEFGIDHLLEAGADYLCPTVPEGQECALPLNPNTYGGSISLILPEFPDLVGDLLSSGTYRVQANFNLEDGTEYTCLVLVLELTNY